MVAGPPARFRSTGLAFRSPAGIFGGQLITDDWKAHGFFPGGAPVRSNRRPGGPAERVAREWLETDGLGGFASGTAELVRTRRYHALLLAAAAPPARRFVLVNGVEAWIETGEARMPITSQVYVGDVRYPDGADRVASFAADPWPRWRFTLPKGLAVEQEVFLSRETHATVVRWRALPQKSGIALLVRPLLSGRDIHALHHENPAFRFEPEERGASRVWRPYEGVPAIGIESNGGYEHDPVWYRRFLYAEDRARGFDDLEDLASPGTFRFDLGAGEAVLILSANPPPGGGTGANAVARAGALGRIETRRREGFGSRLERAADDYLVRRGTGRRSSPAIPGSRDWGRDTFIALRGLCLATGRLDDARDDPAGVGRDGLRRDGAQPLSRSRRAPEYNSVDASLWYVVAVGRVSRGRASGVASAVPAPTANACSSTRSSRSSTATPRARATASALDGDGLLAAGEPGVQLTWMDAKVGDRVVTPRIGKPVEVQALWINALADRERVDAALERARRARGGAAFVARFWNERTRLPLRRRRRRPRPGARRRAVPAEPDLRRRRAAPVRCSRRGSARRVVDVVEARAAHAARAALARARTSPATRGVTRAASASATPRTTRAPSGRG